MRVAMIGAGYVGLVSGACFADFGHIVCCVDKDEGKIARLSAGKMPIYEPKREEEVYINISASNHGPMPADSVKRVFERIIDEMRTIQRNRMLEGKKP